MSGKTYYIDNNGLRHLIKKKIHIDANGNPTQIKKKFFEGKNTFSSSHIVKYHVDVNDIRDVEIDDGGDAILGAPIPVRSGWIFTGWREDDEANPTVVDHKTVEVDGLHLYAVFRKNITITLQGGSTEITNTGVRYHNNSNDESPVMTLGTSTFTGWDLVGYRNDMTATGAVDYTAEQPYTFDESKTIYAVFSRTLTLSYDGNGATGGSTAAQTGTQYYNNGYYGNPSITLRANGFTKANTVSATEYSYTFTGWNLGAAGTEITISDDTTALAQWRATATGRVFIVYNGAVQPGFSLTGLNGVGYSSGNIRWNYTNRLIRLNQDIHAKYPNKTFYVQTSITNHWGNYGPGGSHALVLTASNWYDTHSMNNSPNFADRALSTGGGTISVATNALATTISYNGASAAGVYPTLLYIGFSDGGS